VFEKVPLQSLSVLLILICPTSSSVMSSAVRSYSFVVRGDSCAAMVCAFFDRAAVQQIRRNQESKFVASMRRPLLVLTSLLSWLKVGGRNDFEERGRQ
jgi:hypothetical protein